MALAKPSEAEPDTTLLSPTSPQHLRMLTRENSMKVISSRGLLSEAALKIAKWQGRLVDAHRAERDDFHTICLNSMGAPLRRIDTRKRSMSPGTCFIQPAHSIGQFESDGPLETYHFYLSVDLLEQLALELGLAPAVARDVPEAFGLQDRALSALVEACLSSLMVGHPPSRIELDCWAHAFGIFLLRERRRIATWSRQQPVRSLTETRFARVTEYIEANLAGEVSLGALAQVSEMPQSAFMRAFRSLTGMSPFQYVLRRRIARAAHLLSTQEKSLAEIAYEVGFASQSHMTDVFSKRLGVSPGKYRLARGREGCSNDASQITIAGDETAAAKSVL